MEQFIDLMWKTAASEFAPNQIGGVRVLEAAHSGHGGRVASLWALRVTGDEVGVAG